MGSCLCLENWSLEGKLGLDPGWYDGPFPKQGIGEEKGDCLPNLWRREWTGLLVTETCRDLGGQDQPLLLGISQGQWYQLDHPSRHSKAGEMPWEEKIQYWYLKMDPAFFQGCFDCIETCKSYYKKLLLELISFSFSLQNSKNYGLGNQQIHCRRFFPWSYFYVKSANTRERRWNRKKMGKINLWHLYASFSLG